MKNNTEKKKNNATKKVAVIMAITIVFAAIIFCGVLYVNDYYKAKSIAKRSLMSNKIVTVKEEKEYYLFKPNKKATTKAIVFYPGAKVEEVAYSRLMSDFAEAGYEVFLVKMPMRMAIFDKDAATDIIKDKANKNIKEWTMMGHSMGGAMAANYTAEHTDKVSNLVLLAAYGTKDFSKSNVKVLSLYGSNDKVLNKEHYKKNAKNLPKDAVKYEIEGGNHAGYADYGEQKSDGKAKISPKEQQEEVVDLFLETYAR
ncbi:Alpha/beta hydrolase family protein [Lachnospiraceae bacterium C7]|nr:Alpha/beta hydrolase family protein [Lachnospiraceae bacterium C7]